MSSINGIIIDIRFSLRLLFASTNIKIAMIITTINKTNRIDSPLPSPIIMVVS